MRCTGSRNVVIALGNRFRGDDGAGPHVADGLKRWNDKVEVVEGALDALRILDAWEDASLAVVIDAAAPSKLPGRVSRLELAAELLAKDLGRCSSHGMGLAEAVSLGRIMGKLPCRLVIYAIEAKTFDAGAALSNEVAAAVEQVLRQVEAELESVEQV